MPSHLFVSICVATVLPFWLVFLGYRKLIIAKLRDAQGLLAEERTFDLYRRVFGYSIRAATWTADQREELIKLMFQRYYNNAAYLIAMCLLTSVCLGFVASGVAILLGSWGIEAPLPRALLAVIHSIPLASIAGFWGAYVWALYEIALRYRANDFTPSSAHFIWVKFVASSTVAGFVATVLPAQVRLLAGFCIGSLVLPELLSWTRNRARELLRTKAEEGQAEQPTLQLLRGGTATVVSRLAEVGIESIHHLAYSDPFSLLLQTNLRWTMILDFIDQALLFSYLKESAPLLCASGIRGAIELSILSEQHAKNEKEAARAEFLVKQLAERVGLHETEFRNLAECVAKDYQVHLLSDLFAEAWGETNIVEAPSLHGHPSN